MDQDDIRKPKWLLFGGSGGGVLVAIWLLPGEIGRAIVKDEALALYRVLRSSIVSQHSDPIDTGSIMEQPENSSIAKRKPAPKKPPDEKLLLDRWFGRADSAK